MSLPRDWTSVRGLWTDKAGLYGAVLIERAGRLVVFEGNRVVSADITDWTVREVVACLVDLEVPPNAEPQLSFLSDAELEPLVAAGSLTTIDRLRLLAHVPGWQP